MDIAAPYNPSFYRQIASGVERSGRACAPIIQKLLAPSSVVDVGCGQGDWLRAFADLGVSDVLGIDGDYVRRDELKVPADRFIPHDLTKPFPVPRRFDLALCLEVGEHLPHSHSGNLVRLLTQLAPAVVFSAAIPGQGGVQHVNEQWPWFWHDLYTAEGYVCLDLIRPRIWQHPEVEAYYQQNVYLYVDPSRHQSLLEAHPNARNLQLTLVQSYVLKQPRRGIGGWLSRLWARLAG